MKLGDLVKDSITGFTGIVTCRSEWLNGCVRLSLQPQELREGKPLADVTFDIEQLILVKAAEFKTLMPSGGDRPNVMRAPDPKR
jgi:hypothetical protein